MLVAPSGDWSVFQQIFADHWEAFQHAHPRYQTPYYNGLVGKMLACGNPAKIGYMEYRCLHCGQGKHVVAMSCKSSLCLRCAKVAVDNWVSQVSRVLHEGVIYRHIILTVPAMFRTTFYQHAAVVLSALIRCGAQCLDDFYSTVKGKALKGGVHHGAPHAWPQWAITSTFIIPGIDNLLILRKKLLLSGRIIPSHREFTGCLKIGQRLANDLRL
jgi:Transposase zinc-binding domain